jgi:predicted Zn-dependent protease
MRSGLAARRLIAPALFALLVAGCADFVRMGTTQVSLPEPPKSSDAIQPAQREHSRILAAYGGAYVDHRLEALITLTVDKLVAASERPNLKYKATILNSPAINAVALPNGQLYVTRGLLALANDTSELSSVLSHEMAHVIARHAAIREDQMRQTRWSRKVASDAVQRRADGRDALARFQDPAGELFARQELEADGVGVGISARGL